MTDEDVVVKVASLIGTRVSHHGNIYSTQVYGAYAISWMMTLYPLLYKRRKSAVADVIRFWREHTFGRAPNGAILRGVRSMAKCHPDRLMSAHGLCSSCYMIEWKKKRKLLKLAG